MNLIFSFRYRYEALTRWILIFRVSWSESLCTMNHRLKNHVFSQGPITLNLKYESLVIADYNCVQISSSNVLRIKLWLKEDSNLHTNHFDIHSKSFIGRLTGKTLKKVGHFWPYLHMQHNKTGNLYKFVNWQQLEINFPNLESCSSFGKKVHNTFDHKTSRNQTPLSWSFKTIFKGEQSDTWLRKKNDKNFTG